MMRRTRPVIGPSPKAFSQEISNRVSACATGQSSAGRRTTISMPARLLMVVLLFVLFGVLVTMKRLPREPSPFNEPPWAADGRARQRARRGGLLDQLLERLHRHPASFQFEEETERRPFLGTHGQDSLL